MTRYTAARSLLSFLSLLAWLVILAAGFAAVGALRGGGWPVALGIAVSGVAAGVMLLAVAQTALAQIDTADNSFQQVALLEKLASRAASAPASVAAMPATYAPPPSAPANLIKAYRGFAIIRESVGVSVEGQPFNNVLAAERWIDDGMAARDPAA